jgi:hypothetical protein
MEQRISLVTLGVSDLGRSTAFYERLGWRRSTTKAEGVSFFQAGGMIFALWPVEELAKDAQVAPERLGIGGMSLAQNVRSKGEVDRILDDAVAAGATLLKPAGEVFWGGYTGYFADPDGHLWEVAFNPGFEILPDGSIRLPD